MVDSTLRPGETFRESGGLIQGLRGDAKYKNKRLMTGVKMMEEKRKPQKPIRRCRPTIPATRHSNR